MYQPFIGSIQYYAFGFAPRGWALCAGQLLPVNQNQALFSLLGVNYGGNGSTNFQLPDFRGRTILGQGTSQGASYVMGQVAGTEGATILPGSMPVHTHLGTNTIQITASNVSTGGVNNPVGNHPAMPSERGNIYASAATANDFLGTPSVTVATVGTGQPFSTLSPYLALTCCIALTGIYPSRS